MQRDLGRAKPAPQLLLVPLLLAAVMVVAVAVLFTPNPMIVIGGVGAVVALGLCVVSPASALHFMVVCFLFSPELDLTGGGAGYGIESRRPVTVRLEDAMLGILLVGWVLKMGLRKEMGVALKTGINFPIFVFIGINVLSTAIGVLAGKVTALAAFFFCLKYIEYYLFFFLTANLVETRQQIRRLFATAVVTCVAVCAYGYWQIPLGDRISAPFEGVGEPNTLGGYLMFMLAFLLASFLETRSDRQRVLFGLLSGFVAVPLLYTLSRGSYLACVPMVITMLLVTRKKVLMTSVVLVATIVAVLFMPGTVRERVSETFYQAEYEGQQISLGEDVRLDTSTTARIRSWRYAMRRWLKAPMMAFLGNGATGVGFVDAQYIRVLCETGIFGFAVFMWLLYTMFKEARLSYNLSVSEFDRGLALGYLGGLVGLITHALSANTFIVIRIMEPFWFMTALVLVARSLQVEEEETLTDYLAGGERAVPEYRFSI